jgi:hypothetical protein
MLIISKHGILLMLNVPFRVMVIECTGDLITGDIERVSAVKIDHDLVLMYLIGNSLHYYNHFTILVGDDEY